MNDPQEALKNAYRSALKGNITLNGQVVPVYVAVPEQAKPPYVWLHDQTVSEARILGPCTSNECTLLAEVITAYGVNKANPSETNTIAAQVISLARSIQLTSDVQLLSHWLELSNTLEEINGAELRIRRLLRFRDEVVEVVTV